VCVCLSLCASLCVCLAGVCVRVCVLAHKELLGGCSWYDCLVGKFV
jgi:hypothetical protein